MAQGMMWHCVWDGAWLRGSIRENLTPAERGAWADFLALASESRVRGTICAGKGIPYSLDYLASVLRTPQEVLQSLIDKSVADISEDGKARISFDSTGCMVINNFERYNKVRDGFRKKDKQPISEEAKWGMAKRLGISNPPRFKTIAGNLDDGEEKGEENVKK